MQDEKAKEDQEDLESIKNEEKEGAISDSIIWLKTDFSDSIL